MSFFSPGKKAKDKEEVVEETLLTEYDKYYRLAYSYVGNPDDAADIVQEGAYQAIRYCDTLQNISYVNTWIYRIMLNEIFAFCRKSKREVLPMEEAPEQGKDDTYEDVDLIQALEQLDEKDRAVIVLRYFEEYKLGEIADILEENLSTVKSRLYRGIKKLRLHLENEWIWEED
ncbi:MAG: RNA polymerase sigma factor [Lachnospiraceae bacterium]|nr:RNA polymerase sigma factor [Lachnospiraceae bacterium]